MIEEAYRKAGFRDIQTNVVPTPLRMKNSTDCLRLEQESFGALHQMLSSLDESGKQEAWDEIGRELAAFQGPTV